MNHQLPPSTSVAKPAPRRLGPHPILQFLLQISPIFGYLAYHQYGLESLNFSFADGMSHEQALVNLGLLLPWLTQIAVITTCQNNGYPGKADSLVQDIVGIIRCLLFFSLPVMLVLMTIAVVKLGWSIPLTLKFSGFLLVNLMMSITFVILSIHHLWLWWFFGSMLYIVLLVAVPWTLFAAPIITFVYGLLAIRFARTLPFKLTIMSELDAGFFGLCLGSLLWLDKILWWLSGDLLMHSGSIFLLIIPGVLLAAVYFSFFARSLTRRVEGLYRACSELPAAAYFELVAKMKRYFQDVTLGMITIALLLFLLVVGLMRISEVNYGIRHFFWLATILFQSLSLVFALMLATVLGQKAVVKVAWPYCAAMVGAFLIFGGVFLLLVQVLMAGVATIVFWLECRKSFTHPIELAFVQNIQNPQ